jgi:hypothetical protein
MDIEWIRNRVAANEYIITLHADQERRNDRLDIGEVEAALQNGDIIEDYPDDPRGRSCLVHGPAAQRDVHVVCGRNTSGWLVIITVYLPRPPKWITPRQRRFKE